MRFQIKETGSMIKLDYPTDSYKKDGLPCLLGNRYTYDGETQSYLIAQKDFMALVENLEDVVAATLLERRVEEEILKNTCIALGWDFCIDEEFDMYFLRRYSPANRELMICVPGRGHDIFLEIIETYETLQETTPTIGDRIAEAKATSEDKWFREVLHLLNDTVRENFNL